MARALPPDGCLVTVEREARHAAFAERYVDRAGLSGIVSIRRGRALDVLPSLDGEVFDLVFLDADRAPLATYFDWAVRLTRVAGMVVVHNVLLGGRVADREGKGDDDDLRAVRAFNARLAADPRVTSILVPAYDGFAVAVVSAR
jgi:predicted O-methyltransferase YrrM